MLIRRQPVSAMLVEWGPVQALLLNSVSASLQICSCHDKLVYSCCKVGQVNLQMLIEKQSIVGDICRS